MRSEGGRGYWGDAPFFALARNARGAWRQYASPILPDVWHYPL